MKDHEILEISWNFMIFMKIKKFLENGSLFRRHAKTATKPMEFQWFWGPFFAKIALFAKRGKFPQILQNFRKFPKFHPFWWFSPHFGVLGALGPQSFALLLNEHVFKAKKVTFWKVFHIFAKFHFFTSKTSVFAKKMIFGEFPPFWAQNQFFRPGTSKKAPRTLCLCRVLGGSPQGPVFGRNEWFWGPKPQNGRNSTILGQNWPATWYFPLPLEKGQVFP